MIKMMKEMKMEKTIYGVAYLGDAVTVDENGVRKKSYTLYKGMIRRCYPQTEKEREKHRAYENCTVCDRWLCFANFEKDIESLPNYDLWLKGEVRMSLDKDILQYGAEHKVYSRETCMFVPQSLNAQVAKRETREVVCVNAETGELRVIDNLHEEWGAKSGNIINVCKGIGGNQAYGHYWWYDDFLFEVMDKFDLVKDNLTQEQMVKMNKMIDECNIQKINKYLDKILLSTYQTV